MKKAIYLTTVLFLLSSCFSGRTKPSNFYKIASIENEDIKIRSRNYSVIGIELVSVPGYLDRPEIVTIRGNNTELDISDFNRWAEPLSSSIQRTIANNLSMYLKNSTIRPMNLYRKTFDYTVAIYIIRFEGKFNDKVYLDSWYSIYNRNGINIANERVKFDTELGDSYDDLVEQQSLLISKLSEEIAKKLARL